MASIDSNYAERDKHLRSRDFLDADMYPEAVFKSTGYRENPDGSGYSVAILPCMA